MKYYFLSTTRMTVLVETNREEKITSAPPITKKFIGQPISNLIYWMKKQPGFYMEILNGK